MTAQELSPDTLIHERYRIVRPIGRGGMGAVYEAIDERLGHRVALKQTLVVGEAGARAFEREARVLAGVRHPALPAVTDFFAEDRGRFLVMQHIPGKTLAELSEERGGPFPVSEVLAWADELLAALEYLHGRQPQVLHRDIKPSNLKLTAEGEVVLLDFGLAKGSGETTSTGASVYGLTPQFAPLEQFQGTGTEPVSDLFSLAGTLYFLVCGSPPVDALTRASAVAMGKSDPLPTPRELSFEVPQRVSSWLLRALAIHKQDRPPSATAMRRELREIRSGITATEPPTQPMEEADGSVGPPTVTTPLRAAPRTPGGRGPLPWIALGLAASLLVAIGGWLAFRAFEGSVTGGADAAITRVEGEGLEVEWPGSDLWTLYRGDEKVAIHSASWDGEVPAGRYRIVPIEAVFPPVEFAVAKGRKTVVRPRAGRFELEWKGPDLWTLFRGTQKVALHSGTRDRVLSPGAYRIVPSEPVFEPIEFSVLEGKDTLLKPPAGSFDLQWAGDDLWTLFRGTKKIALHSGSRSRTVSPGAYRILPADPVFEPIEFTIEDGQDKLLKPPAGRFELQWASVGDGWTLYRGERKIATHYGSRGRVLAAGAYRIVPSKPVFQPIDFTISDGQQLVLKPK